MTEAQVPTQVGPGSPQVSQVSHSAATKAEPLLELRGIRAAYGTIEVLHGVDLAVEAGTVVALLGPNGAGKSTTLQVACGLMKPSSGSVL